MTDYNVLWTNAARDDLEAIANYTAEDSDADTALRIIVKIEQRCQALISMPKRGVVVPELRDIGLFHYRQLSERPWRIFYRIHDHKVFVIAVIDGRRDITSFLMERLIR